jgi:folate-dependent phosphoribosylglycinamide formyltransferase PurN
MRIAILGPRSATLTSLLTDAGHEVVEYENQIDMAWLQEKRIDFIVSYRYRHIIRGPILTHYDGRAVNLHISMLPWNRGADPNLWSFLDDTPKGVTIHYLDAGIDTGDIIIQEEAAFAPMGETLASTYETLNAAVLNLFAQHFVSILAGTCERRPQLGVGSSHRIADTKPYRGLLAKGWNTPVGALRFDPRRLGLPAGIVETGSSGYNFASAKADEAAWKGSM